MNIDADGTVGPVPEKVADQDFEKAQALVNEVQAALYFGGPTSKDKAAQIIFYAIRQAKEDGYRHAKTGEVRPYVAPETEVTEEQIKGFLENSEPNWRDKK